MDSVSLLPVHHRKGVAPRLLLALLGQLHQLRQLVVDHSDETRILLQPILQVVRVPRVQLRSLVRVADLQTNRHATIPLQNRTAVVALQLLGRRPLDRPEEVLQPRRAATATLHVLQKYNEINIHS